MSREAEFIRAEMPDIAKIIKDECWLEGERRGQPVDPKEPEIQDRVADIILNGFGAKLREARENQGY